MANLDNLRGILLMILAMAAFATTDAFIKSTTGVLPQGQIIFILSGGGALIFTLVASRQGVSILDRRFFHPAVLARNASEILATVSFIYALAAIELSLLSALIQAVPLLVTLAAALVLGEVVGLRRWTAVLIGLAGVLLIVQPWGSNLTAGVAIGLCATVGLALRDFFTRLAPPGIPTPVLAAWSLYVLTAAGLVLMVTTPPVALTAPTALALGAGILSISVAYFAITAAMRVGEVSVVAPFRYSRVVIGVFYGIVLFGERPDAMTYLGTAIVVASGIYIAWRERRARQATAPLAGATR